jgi:hypothetical protein
LHQVHGFRPRYWGVEPFVLPMDIASETAQRFASYGRKVILLEQTSPLSPITTTDFLPGVHRVYFPHLQLQSWWPKEGSELTANRLKRYMDFDLAAMKRSESSAGWDAGVSTYIEENVAIRPLFSMFVHPDGVLMTMLLRGICNRLRQIEGMENINPDHDLPDLLDFYSDHPIRSDVARCLELKWAEASWYQGWTEAVAAHCRGDLGESIVMHESWLGHPDINHHIWGSYAKVLFDAGRGEDAHRAFGIAHRRFPHNALYARRWVETLAQGPLSDEQEPLIGMIKEIYQPADA